MPYAPLTKVIVENYQSLGLAEVELGGLTVIVGRGDLGKSAFLRAMQACIFNETGSAFIRQGQKTTSVSLLMGKEAITWIKTDKTSRYLYDDPEGNPPAAFTKLAGGVPKELQDVLGIRNIEIDKTFSITPQIHGQFDSPILLAESSGKAARALAKLTKLEVVITAQVAAARDLRRTKQDATAREREVGELTKRLEEFPDIGRIETRLQKAHDILLEADLRINVLGDAEDAFSLMLDAKRRMKVTPPSVDELEGLTERLSQLTEAILVWKDFQQATAAVESTRKALVAKNLELQSAEEELDTYLQSLGTCPVCGQPMDGEHVDE